MAPQDVLQIMQSALHVIILMVSVVLLPALAVGLTVSMFQAATQINEMTLSFIPKLLVTMMVLAIAGQWLLGTIVNFTVQLFKNIPYAIG
ncbi:MAG: flagellar biosynthesis protein FliQ [Sulfuriflexus sp.]|nr:flagellar biosynthesis protein FliQ [Sulfuriflexus sp.]